MSKQNPVALISGASRGIGEAIAYYFAEQNYHLVLVARSEDKLLSLKEKLEKITNGEIKIFALDISDPNAIEQAWQAIIEQFKRLDVLVNNAGIVEFGTTTLTPEALRKTLAVNLEGAYYWTSHVVPIMKIQKAGNTTR